MLRGWLTGVAFLVGIGLSFADASNPTLLRDRRWEEGRKQLAEGKAGAAKAVFDELLKDYPRE
ncbi:MAG: hypothetical protein ACXW48_20330, partial [Candidatus Binatia bacterium]